jgi:hypothetical protein
MDGDLGEHNAASWRVLLIVPHSVYFTLHGHGTGQNPAKTLVSYGLHREENLSGVLNYIQEFFFVPASE